MKTAKEKLSTLFTLCQHWQALVEDVETYPKSASFSLLQHTGESERPKVFDTVHF